MHLQNKGVLNHMRKYEFVIFEQCFSGKLVYTGVQLMLGILLLTMDPLIKNQLSPNLDLPLLKLCPMTM